MLLLDPERLPHLLANVAAERPLGRGDVQAGTAVFELVDGLPCARARSSPAGTSRWRSMTLNEL